MVNVIKGDSVIADDWQIIQPQSSSLPLGKVMVPWRDWRNYCETLFAQHKLDERGVWLAPDDELDDIEQIFSQISMIAIDFPIFRDGRGYSLAYLLRRRYHWKGELRAIGDVQRDQLLSMWRCGFDAFALRDDQDPVASLAAFKTFSEQYQASVVPELPLFKRRQFFKKPQGAEHVE